MADLSRFFPALVAVLLALLIPSARANAQLWPMATITCEDWRLFRDVDFFRHQATLDSLNPCISYEPFVAGGIEWRLTRLQQGPLIPREAPLVVVLHDDENAALTGALGLLALRDVQVVMLDAEEGRLWGGVDPNRMFVDFGAVVASCPHPLNLDHRFAAAILRDWTGTVPILSLHSNAPGFQGDGEGGRGSISMLAAKPHQQAFPAAPDPRNPRLSDPDNLIYMAGPTPLPGPLQSALLEPLRQTGLNVLYSQINPMKQDCSLSDYLTLRGQSDLYFNIEVEAGDTAAALTMIRKLMRVLDQYHEPQQTRP